jgi:hypothetical protein
MIPSQSFKIRVQGMCLSVRFVRYTMRQCVVAPHVVPGSPARKQKRNAAHFNKGFWGWWTE